ncbi:MAG: hypothetical protein E7438_08130 [Ruminococcaceae bacterium]|nr:hypothetical protein [Oscillospiraceae bacterium]
MGKKKMWIWIGIIGGVVLLTSLVLGGYFGYKMVQQMLQPAAEPKTFYAESMQITLTDQFAEEKIAGYTAAFTSDQVAVFVLKETFAEVSDKFSVEEYGQQVIRVNGLSATLQTENGVVYFEYDADTQDGAYHYVAVVCKGPSGFWLIQFATRKSNAKLYRDDILGWAESIVLE